MRLENNIMEFKESHLLELANNRLVLLREKAVLLPDEDSLVVSDLHLGKSIHFRKNGIAIPDGATEGTLSALQELLEKYPVGRLIVLGDLFHSDINSDWHLVREFTERYTDTEFLLVRGNHDLFPDKIYHQARFFVEDEYRPGPSLLLSHEPFEGEDPADGMIRLSGHLHPGIVLRGRGRSRLRLPCFWFGKNFGILPAFGKFTGMKTVKPRPAQHFFPIAEGGIVVLNKQQKGGPR